MQNSIVIIFLLITIKLVLPTKKIYDLILGWSTGHVGTTSLSDPAIFKDTTSISMAHELDCDSRLQFNKEKWQVSSYKDEYKFVSHTYIPTVLAYRGSKKTFF